MAALIHLAVVLACLETAWLYPTSAHNLAHFMSALAKRPLEYYENPDLYRYALPYPQFLQGNSNGQTRGVEQRRREAARKKAIDDTFIRFGRSSLPPIDSPKPGDLALETAPGPDLDPSRQLFVRQGCHLEIGEDMVKTILANPSCFKLYHSGKSGGSKRENVNDTFIRFGKSLKQDGAEKR